MLLLARYARSAAITCILVSIVASDSFCNFIKEFVFRSCVLTVLSTVCQIKIMCALCLYKNSFQEVRQISIHGNRILTDYMYVSDYLSL